LLPLCRVLEAIRTACGNRHIEIVSGFRTVPYNARIGGAAHSQHCQGTAADVRVDGLPPSEVYAAAMALFKAGEIEALGGAGQYTGWCHFDVRKRPADGHLAVWTGNGVGSEVA
jgi:uncharacterized protein YcbK (DUF882 family)